MHRHAFAHVGVALAGRILRVERSAHHHHVHYQDPHAMTASRRPSPHHSHAHGVHAAIVAEVVVARTPRSDCAVLRVVHYRTRRWMDQETERTMVETRWQRTSWWTMAMDEGRGERDQNWNGTKNEMMVHDDRLHGVVLHRARHSCCSSTDHCRVRVHGHVATERPHRWRDRRLAVPSSDRGHDRRVRLASLREMTQDDGCQDAGRIRIDVGTAANEHDEEAKEAMRHVFGLVASWERIEMGSWNARKVEARD